MNALLTISVGEKYQKMAEVTHPSLERYAERIGAQFVVIDEYSSSTPHFEKFQIYNMLNKYNRIIYLDTDIIVREDCPNLFEVVPYDKLGVFNEGAFIDRTMPMVEVAKQYKISIDKWNRQYYNTGVMVLSRVHKFLFKPPEVEISNFFEQSYLNLNIIKSKIS